MTVAVMDGPWVTEDVLGLLRRQAALFARLEQFAARQRGLVRSHDPGPLLSLLADRQRLSAELTNIAGRLAPVRSAWNRFRESLTGSERAEADGLLAESSQRLRRVIESDETDARLLSVRKRAVAGEMRALNGVGQAISVYRAPAQRAVWASRLDEST